MSFSLTDNVFAGLPLILAQAEDGTDAPPPPPVGDELEGPVGQPVAPGQPGQGQPAPAPRGTGNEPMFPILMAVILFFFVFTIMSQRKDKKKREEMFASIKKGDRVQTVGGILGTVVDVRDDELVLKVDENNNTRLHVKRNAVQSVVDEKS